MQVRSASSGDGNDDRGLGLFAEKDFNVGDVVVEEESPLTRLGVPSSIDEESTLVQWLLQANNNSHSQTPAESIAAAAEAASSTAAAVVSRAAAAASRNNVIGCRLWDVIKVSEGVPNDHHGKFKGMVQVGLCIWNHLVVDNDSRNNSNSKTTIHHRLEQLLELYYPQIDSKNEEEHEILRTAQLAAQYIVDVIVKSNHQQSITNVVEKLEATLEKILLIWSCNSFEGGRIYKTISRINHSCNPNAIIQTDDNNNNICSGGGGGGGGEKQCVRAMTAIRAGEEITISYLGLFLYAERPIRQAMLRNTKHFTCDCDRCRTEKQDPNTDVAASVPCPRCHPRESGGRQLDEETQYDEDRTSSYVCGWTLTMGNHTTTAKPATNTTPIVVEEDDNKWVDKEALISAMHQVRSKALTFLQDKRPPNNRKAGQGQNYGDRDEDDVYDELVQAEMLDKQTTLASSVMGAKHWTTNLLMLYQLDELLKSTHKHILLNDEPPGMMVLAEAVDMLQQLTRFVDGFTLMSNMDHKKGHLLCSVMIGTARALISEGDFKSQRYAVKWVEPIRDYIRLFEEPGMMQVIDTIVNAHKKHSNTDNEDSSYEDSAEVNTKRAKAE